MVAILEIMTDNGKCHCPDFHYIALSGSLTDMDREAMEIVKDLHKSESIGQVKIGESKVEVWTDTRLCF